MFIARYAMARFVWTLFNSEHNVEEIRQMYYMQAGTAESSMENNESVAD